MSDLSLASARFKYLERPIQNPGTCCVCGNPNRPVVDFGTNLHQRNSVWVLYICILCIKDAYDTVDILSGDRERRESEASRSLRSELDKKNLVAITREQLDNLLDLSNHFNAATDELLSADLPEDDEPVSGESPILNLEPEQDDRKSTEPVPTLTF